MENFDIQSHQQIGIRDDVTEEFRVFVDSQTEDTAEDLFENLNSTPIGRLLGLISSLPEIRQEKVVAVRQQISDGHYEGDENLDMALDMVLEELIAEG